MTEAADIEDLASEYVLGTLDATERAAVETRRVREPTLDGAIVVWQRRLAPLDSAVAPLTPRPDLFDDVMRRIGMPAPTPPPDRPAAEVIALRRRLGAWRATAVASLAAAACLLAFVGVREWQARQQPANLFAVFQKDDASPAFIMTVDLATRTLAIRRIGADLPPDKAYQLWIVSDQLPPGPHSLGLLGSDGTVKTALDRLDPSVVRSALFGISLEQPGGSPSGKPTGPALHSRLFTSSL